MIPKWKIKKVKVSALKNFSKNPRHITGDQQKHLKESIDKFGLIDKPIINQDMTIIGGHQRKEIYDGEEIEVWYPDRKLTEEEVKELNIRLNANTGIWDWDLVKELNFNDLQDWGLDFNSLGKIEDGEEIQNEAEMWKEQGMPEFTTGDKEIRLMIYFEDESERDEFIEKHGIEVYKKQSPYCWTAKA